MARVPSRALAVLVMVLVTVSPTVACQATQSPPVELTSFQFVVKATPAGAMVDVTVDAIDQFGGHGASSDGGKPYPFEAIRRTPYTHTVYYQPGLVVSASLRATIQTGSAGEVLGCDVYDTKGHKVKAASSVSGTGSVVCLYTSAVPGVPAFEKPPGR